jgi:hypothetical protein
MGAGARGGRLRGGTKGVIDKNKSVTLAADVFFVDGIAFLLKVSRNIKFITAEHMATRTAKSLSKHLDHVIRGSRANLASAGRPTLDRNRTERYSV